MTGLKHIEDMMWRRDLVDMYVFGITGGVGAGKSTVLDMLEREFGAFVIKADEVGHLVMEPGQKAYGQIVEVFGEGILCKEGLSAGNQPPIDRGALAQVIFSSPNKRLVLNSIVHPLVKSHIMEEVARIRCGGEYEYCFVEAALLIEEHYEVICDELWYIYADEETRRKRLKESRGYTDEKIGGILASQLTDEEFRKHCQRVIDNSADEASTLQQLKEIMDGYGKLGKNQR